MTWLHPLNFQPSAQLRFHMPNLFLPQGLRAGCSFWGALSLTYLCNLGSTHFSLKVLIGTPLWSECPLPVVPGRNPRPRGDDIWK